MKVYGTAGHCASGPGVRILRAAAPQALHILRELYGALILGAEKVVAV